MGKNISVYLDDETIRWLDEYRKIHSEKPKSQGKAIKELLFMVQTGSFMLAGMLKAQIALKKSLKNSQE